jgi:hypothetical protein
MMVPESALRGRVVEAESPRSRPEPPAARRKKPKARTGGSGNTKTILLLVFGGVVLLGCVVIGGVGAYFLSTGSSVFGPGTREQLVGQWETDPDFSRMQAAGHPLGMGMHIDLGLTFNADQTFHQRHILNLNGRWSIDSGFGKSARVRMVVKFGQRDSDPVYAQVTFIDSDHIDWDQNGVTMRYRRVGTTSPSPQVPLTPSVTPRVEGPGGGGFGRGRDDFIPPVPKSRFGPGPSGIRPGDPNRPGGRAR